MPQLRVHANGHGRHGRGHDQQQRHHEATSGDPGGVGDLWARAAELERQFAGYKQRLAGRKAEGGGGGGGDGDGGGEGEETAGGDGRGRMYEAYARRRDERLREGWRARMERKEAEMKALWARLERGGGGGGAPSRACPSREQKLDDTEKSSYATPTSISAKKHSLARSLSSTTSSPTPSATDHRRTALLLEPPQALPPTAAAASESRKENRVPSPAAATASRPKTSARTQGSANGQGAAGAGPRPPRSQPPRSSSGGAGEPKELAVANPDAVPGAESSNAEPFLRGGNGIGPGHGHRAAALSSAPPADEDGDTETTRSSDKNAGIKKHNEEETTRSPDKSKNAGIGSDSDTEPSYVYIKKESDARSKGHPRQEPGTDDAMANAIAAEATGESSVSSLYSNVPSSFSNRSGAGASAPDSPLGSPPSIERLLEVDASHLRKRREAGAEKDVLTPSTPNSRVCSTTQSPRDAPRGIKRLLNFGKRNRGSEVTVIECTSPSVASLVDDDDNGETGAWLSADAIKPRMGSSADASDDLDSSYIISPHAHSLHSFVPASPAKSEQKEIIPPAKSPRAHRSFFSFPSFKCSGGDSKR